ncbi:hypothetical protein A2442_02005 [Candidatus Campbellbacteria bacterium RIFOXYC2_FULL_35_25]|uniref:DUF8128 domain-containing protein n=1 Tax=Candidatus Campbellbacteria bacterium RIFOXYC2_FULL_35_25 TaxID=1797582 RepID=A0A1F5EIJ3_9BACT|nr:MAG: hypothetical protein A2442_02005 [Candidatus Campbellbacteria bacterium RIFOXYC2_FULL_35_25]
MENFEQRKFNNPEEELQYLRKELSDRQQAERLSGNQENFEPKREERSIMETIQQYKEAKPEEVITEEFRLGAGEIEKIVLNLPPEEHDETMTKLLGLLEEKGIKNALMAVEELNNPHIEDDFHRVLIQYVKNGYIEKSGSKEKHKELRMTLFEIVLPEFSRGGERPDIQSLIAPMEQFYAGMLSIADQENLGYFSLEIAASNNSDDLVVYCTVPDNKIGLFEKQISAVFPGAKIKEKKDDFNIFRKDYSIKGANVLLHKRPFWGLKTYENFSNDPINVVLSSFSRLTRDEGAAIQFVVDTRKNNFNSKFQNGIRELQAGKSVTEAFGEYHLVLNLTNKLLNSFFSSPKKVEAPKDLKEAEKNKVKSVDQDAINNIQEKISHPILPVNIRVVVSAKGEVRADMILNEIESSFNQFTKPYGNNIIFVESLDKKLKNFLYNFSFRIFDNNTRVLLNTKELSTIFHFPSVKIKQTNIIESVE